MTSKNKQAIITVAWILLLYPFFYTASAVYEKITTEMYIWSVQDNIDLFESLNRKDAENVRIAVSRNEKIQIEIEKLNRETTENNIIIDKAISDTAYRYNEIAVRKCLIDNATGKERSCYDLPKATKDNARKELGLEKR